MTEHRPDRAIALAASLTKIQRIDQPYFVCPDCGRFSANPDDVENSYCGNCHQFKFMTFFGRTHSVCRGLYDRNRRDISMLRLTANLGVLAFDDPPESH